MTDGPMIKRLSILKIFQLVILLSFKHTFGVIPIYEETSFIKKLNSRGLGIDFTEL